MNKPKNKKITFYIQFCIYVHMYIQYARVPLITHLLSKTTSKYCAFCDHNSVYTIFSFEYMALG